MRRFFVLVAFFMISAFLFAPSQKEIDRYLRNYSEQGYRFLKSAGENAWYVAFKLPEWKKEWPVVVMLLRDQRGTEIVSVGTTVARFNIEPTPALMRYLLQKNGEDINIGAFSLYVSDGYYVQYFVRILNNYCTLDQIMGAVEWTAGYCNATERDIVEFMK